MCGIHGIMNLGGHSAAINDEQVRRMGVVAEHRGPDDFGLYNNGNCAIGMQRLAIIDVDSGKQPLMNAG